MRTGLLSCGWLDCDNELRIDVRETAELGLVQVHDEQLVGGSQLGCFAGELTVEVANVPQRFLLNKNKWILERTIQVILVNGNKTWWQQTKAVKKRNGIHVVENNRCKFGSFDGILNKVSMYVYFYS